MKCYRRVHKPRWMAENDCQVCKNKSTRAKRAKLLFSLLKMQICDVLEVVGVVVA